MPVRFTQVVAARGSGNPATFSVDSIDILGLGPTGSAVVMLDEFRLRGSPFGPHPHAGFSAVSYLFPDSEGPLRSRTSLGDNLVVGPGGICWTQAGSGALHEEIPAVPDRALHGVQIFVNLSARNKMAPPQVLSLDAGEIPVWTNDDGDRVRVVVGTYAGRQSPLRPIEPFHLFDVELRRGITVDLPHDHVALLYVLDGDVALDAGGATCGVKGKQAVAAMGTAGPTEPLRLHARTPSRVLVMVSPRIDEPVVAQGPFIQNDDSQIAAAFARYRSGQMGLLRPYSEVFPTERKALSASKKR